MATVESVYNQAINCLHKRDGVSLDVRELLCFINGYTSKEEFYQKKSEKIKDLRLFITLFLRYLEHEPIEYLINKSTFLGKEFYVDNRVLIPRMESEEVVLKAIEKANEVFKGKEIEVADICSGSGVLGISFSLQYKKAKLTFVDIDFNALEVNKANAKKHGLCGEKYHNGDNIEPLIKNKQKVDLIICNPPYILNEEEIDEGVLRYEKRSFLIDKEPYYVYKEILKKAPKIKKDKLLIVFEIGYDTKAELEKMLKENYPHYKYEFFKDINKKDRILVVTIDE